MLEKKEDALMRAIFSFATVKGGCCIIRPVDLLALIPYNVEFRADDLEPVMSVLEMDDYIESVKTDKKGEMYFCIELKKKGLAYQRALELEKKNKKSKIVFKIILTIIGVALSTVLSRFIIPLIFNK